MHFQELNSGEAEMGGNFVANCQLELLNLNSWLSFHNRTLSLALTVL